MRPVAAIFENGAFHPTEPVDLPEHTPVLVEFRLLSELPVEGRDPAPPQMSPGLAKVYDILGERYASGHTDTAERHNEHQP
jgi:hypothetical protein